jgi:adenosylmethionine-8-amino-7-oxononanoate aminotransferase
MHDRDWVQMAEEGGPLVVVEGDGIRVTDSDGKSWIDVNGGYASVNIGYGRTEIAEAVREQMLRLSYFPQGATTEPLVRFVEKLAEIAPGSLERAWPVTGGSEANETAIKIARAYHKRMGDAGRYKIISRRGSYHGATGGVMWLGSGDRSDYEPGYQGAVYAPQPNPYRCELGGETPSECAVRCAQAVEDLIRFHGAKTVAAVIAEPVSAASAAAVPGDEYWPMLRQICDRYGVLLIADEVVCGFGRTGKMFALEHWGVVPDIMTVAKGVTSCYLPLAAAIATTQVADAFAGEDNVFRQALTFGGHPVAAVAALENIDILERDGLVQNSAKTGAYFLEQLRGLMEDHLMIGDARGIGLLLGIELVADRETKEAFPKSARVPERLSEKFRERGLILRVGGARVGFCPPLCITRDEVDEIVAALDSSIGELEIELATSG